jgi:hypothetical protein
VIEKGVGRRWAMNPKESSVLQGNLIMQQDSPHIFMYQPNKPDI